MATITNETKTLSGMRDFVYFLINEDDEDFLPADVNRAINAGLAHVFEITDEQFTKAYRTTEVGVNEYDIPEARLRRGAAVVKSAWIAADNATTPTELTFRADYTIEDPEVEQDEPTAFYISGDNIGLYPTPDGEYILSILYQTEIPTLDDDSDETEMSDIQIQAALYYAAYLMKVRDEELAMANYFKGMCDEELQKLIPERAGVYNYLGVPNA